MLLYIFAAISLSFATFAKCALFLDIGIISGKPLNSLILVKIFISKAKDI